MKNPLSLPSPSELGATNRARVLALCGLVAAVVFGLDLALPRGVAEAVPYVLAVLISLWSPNKRDTLWVAGACSVLTVVGLVLSPKGGAMWMAEINRVLALFAIWVVALLALKIKESDDSVRGKSQILTGILTNMPAVVFRLDETGYITQSVGKGLQRIGLKHVETAGRTALEPPPEVKARMQQLKPGETLFYESHGSHQGGQWWFLNSITPDTVTGSGAIAFGIDITDRKKVERRLAAHHAVTDVLAEAESPKDALPHLLRAICEGLGWVTGAMWLVDQRHDVLRCVEQWQMPSADVEAFTRRTSEITFAKGVGLPGRVWDTGEPAWIEDVVEDPNFPRAPDAEKGGLHAGFCFPIKISDRVWGAMEFFSPEIQEPDEGLLNMFASLGTQIGQFIERQNTDQRLAAHHAVTLVLAEPSTLEHTVPNLLRAICETLRFEMGAIWTLDGKQGVLRCAGVWHAPNADVTAFESRTQAITLAQGVGLPGRAWQTGQPAWIEDIVENPAFPRAEDAAKGGLHAGFCFPVTINGRFWGVMEFYSREIKEPDQKLLKMFAALGSQIGQFIGHKQPESSHARHERSSS